MQCLDTSRASHQPEISTMRLRAVTGTQPAAGALVQGGALANPSMGLGRHVWVCRHRKGESSSVAPHAGRTAHSLVSNHCFRPELRDNPWVPELDRSAEWVTTLCYSATTGDARVLRAAPRTGKVRTATAPGSAGNTLPDCRISRGPSMVSVVDIACVRVGRLDIKQLVDTRRCRQARIDGCTPVPRHGYAGYRGAEDTAPGDRVDPAR